MNDKDFPKTELEFHEKFSTEEKCIDYLFSVRWPHGFICPKCGHTAAWHSTKHPERWVCKNRDCGRQTSIRVGTVLHKSRKPLREWMLTMFLMVTNKQSVSALRLQRLTGHGSYHTSTRWLRELRRAMGVELSKRELLGPIVEVDEMGIGGKSDMGTRGKGSEKKTWVVGAVESIGGHCGRARFQVLNRESAEEIGAFVQKTVSKDAVIKTDWTPVHLALAAENFIDPRVVKESAEEKEELRTAKRGKEKGAKNRAETYLPSFHRVVSLVKRVSLSAHQGAVQRHLQLYLDEYCYRFDGRNLVQMFSLIQDLVHSAYRTQCVPYWKSCGRVAPRVSNYNQSTGFKVLALDGGA
jgi:transposase-like protein